MADYFINMCTLNVNLRQNRCDTVYDEAEFLELILCLSKAFSYIFDVVLNGEHTIVDELDIFAKVGRGVAHDEMLTFSVKNGKVRVNGETSQIDGKITVEFIKGDSDNPKINAIYVMKGTLDDVPKLPPLPGADTPHGEEEEEEEEDESSEARSPSKSRRPSGPKVQDPYAADDTSTMLLPVFVAIGAFIPLLFCLCRL
eukprot:XP_014783029.1 PREDICTED: malectin-B-like [Octopus bimaculoides]